MQARQLRELDVGGAFPMMDGWRWIGENGAALSATATMLTAAVAVLALRGTASDSRARTRPMVVAELREARHSDNDIDLVVRNHGQSMARDVRVTFAPMLSVPDVGGPYALPYLVRRYASPIPVLTPGQELANIWWAGGLEGGSDLVNQEPTPDEVDVTVEYSDGRRHKYRDVFHLTTETVRMTTYVTSTDSTKGRLKSIDTSLKKTAGALDKLAKSRAQ